MPYFWSQCLTCVRTIIQGNFQKCYALHKFYNMHLLLRYVRKLQHLHKTIQRTRQIHSPVETLKIIAKEGIYKILRYLLYSYARQFLSFHSSAFFIQYNTNECLHFDENVVFIHPSIHLSKLFISN
jgi:hypothetical protein